MEELNKIIKDNYKNIELLSFTKQSLNCYNIELSVSFYPLKIITDFNNYCYCKSDIILLERLNMLFITNDMKTENYIFNILDKFEFQKKENKVQSIDKFHIYQKYEILTKYKLDFEMLEKNSHLYRNSQIINNNISQNLLFNSNQVYNIIVNEIKKINQNMDYKHYVIPIDNNIYNLKLVLYLNDIFIELKIILDSKLYPFVPPKIDFITQTIKLPLVLSLSNLDILKIKYWNSTITMEWLIEQLTSELEPIIKEYISDEKSINFEWNNIITKLISIVKLNNEKQIFNIKPVLINKSDNIKQSSYWSSGTGYGSYNDSNNWDILAYIKESELINIELEKILTDIYMLYNISKNNNYNVELLMIYIINSIKGLTLLELDKNLIVYNKIFNILNIINLDTISHRINEIVSNLTNIVEEIKIFQNHDNIEIYKKILDIYKIYNDNKKIIIDNNIIDNTIIINTEKQKYEEVMKKLQFVNFDIQPNHLFFGNTKDKSNTKAIMRMISEMSSFKTGLPLNWESTIWVRYSTVYNNVFSFFISGPKDTPYENGIFEFHAAFPINYPTKEPYVLLNTTGKNTVRFNPNLYNCGKVCLSLLGTWSGQENEKWNPKTSTFLQVLVSIQSLILIEQPYFNEPGYEKRINTNEGKILSDNYNEPLKIATIKWAINDMIRNPPNGMEEVIKEHFKFKKEEIIKTTTRWYDEMSKNKSSNLQLFQDAYNEMLTLI
jgi:ubiquitin-protein ligase